MRARILLAVVVLFAAGGLTRAQDKPLERAELDKRAVTAAYEAAKQGTDIFNKGNYEGCYRLYEGTLRALAPMLDHRAKLQDEIKQRLDRASKLKTPDAAAFELRAALDAIQNDIAPGKGAADPTKKGTLWDRLGGEKAVKAVVHDFVLAAAEDKKVNFTRGKPIDAKAVAHLEQMLVELISATTGGPLKYTGKSMKEVHKGMGITDAEFDALAGVLVATLKKYKVPQADIDELVKIVASTRPDIVEKPLWDRLGGEKAVKAVVHDFVLAAAEDKKVNFTRGKPIDAKAVEHLEQMLVELISAHTGGPLKYTGKSMKDVHKGMMITDAEFDALGAVLVATLKKYKVPQADIDELVKIVESTRADIVEKK